MNVNLGLEILLLDIFFWWNLLQDTEKILCCRTLSSFATGHKCIVVNFFCQYPSGIKSCDSACSKICHTPFISKCRARFDHMRSLRPHYWPLILSYFIANDHKIDTVSKVISNTNPTVLNTILKVINNLGLYCIWESMSPSQNEME